MNNSLPPSLQKIIIEYCYYPKLYLEELKEKTNSIYDFILYYDGLKDLGYSYHRVVNCKGKCEITLDFTCPEGNGRKNLMIIKNNRDNIFGIKQCPGNRYQKGYYLW